MSTVAAPTRCHSLVSILVGHRPIAPLVLQHLEMDGGVCQHVYSASSHKVSLFLPFSGSSVFPHPVKQNVDRNSHYRSRHLCTARSVSFFTQHHGCSDSPTFLVQSISQLFKQPLSSPSKPSTLAPKRPPTNLPKARLRLSEHTMTRRPLLTVPSTISSPEMISML